MINLIVNGQDSIPNQNVLSSNNKISYSEIMIEVFDRLDKTQISTGLLLDKSFQMTAMSDFDGNNIGSVIFESDCRQFYRQLFDVSIENWGLIHPDSISKFEYNLINENQRNNISIVIANIKYNELKTDAIRNNLIDTINGKFYDVIGRAETPYTEKRFFSSVMLNNKVYGQATFRLEEILLQKIEEMTLHLIRLEKEVQQLKIK